MAPAFDGVMVTSDPELVAGSGLDASGVRVDPFTVPPTSGWLVKLPEKTTMEPVWMRTQWGVYSMPAKLIIVVASFVLSMAVLESQPFTMTGMPDPALPPAPPVPPEPPAPPVHELSALAHLGLGLESPHPTLVERTATTAALTMPTLVICNTKSVDFSMTRAVGVADFVARDRMAASTIDLAAANLQQ